MYFIWYMISRSMELFVFTLSLLWMSPFTSYEPLLGPCLLRPCLLSSTVSPPRIRPGDKDAGQRPSGGHVLWRDQAALPHQRKTPEKSRRIHLFSSTSDQHTGKTSRRSAESACSQWIGGVTVFSVLLCDAEITSPVSVVGLDQHVRHHPGRTQGLPGECSAAQAGH